jgi:hypothetical protein
LCWNSKGESGCSFQDYTLCHCAVPILIQEKTIFYQVELYHENHKPQSITVSITIIFTFKNNIKLKTIKDSLISSSTVHQPFLIFHGFAAACSQRRRKSAMAVLAVPRYEEVVGPIENKILFSRVLWFKSFF